MLKLFTTLIVLSLLSLLPGFISVKPARHLVVPETQPTPNATPELESVTLNDDVVVLQCPWMKMLSCSENGPNVKVSSVVKNASKTGVEYYYIVTGGKIIGQGTEVTWHFEDTKPGKYEITVGIGRDNVIFGKTITKTIDVRECECDPPKCECPTITILGPKGSIKPGDSVLFEAKVEGGSQKASGYQWSVSNGTIVTGQDRVQMIVKTSPEKAETLTVSLTVSGSCPGCPNEASKTILLTK